MLKILKVQSQQEKFLKVICAVTNKLFDEEHNFLELLINKKNEQFSVGYISYTHLFLASNSGIIFEKFSKCL